MELKVVKKAAVSFAAFACVAGMALSAGAAPANARQIEAAAKNQSVMARTMKGMSDKEQKAYVQAVCQAVAADADSTGAKNAKFTAIAQYALANAKNPQEMLAEIFAEIPVESLPAVVDALAAGLFSRAGTTYSDEDFANRARGGITTIMERLKASDDAQVRASMAAAMFVKASGGTPADLADQLAQKIAPDNSKNIKNWIKSASIGVYDPVLSAAGVDSPEEGFSGVVAIPLQISPYAMADNLLAAINGELATGAPVPSGSIAGSIGDDSTGDYRNDIFDPVNEIPYVTDPNSPANPNNPRGTGYRNQL